MEDTASPGRKKSSSGQQESFQGNNESLWMQNTKFATHFSAKASMLVFHTQGQSPQIMRHQFRLWQASKRAQLGKLQRKPWPLQKFWRQLSQPKKLTYPDIVEIRTLKQEAIRTVQMIKMWEWLRPPQTLYPKAIEAGWPPSGSMHHCTTLRLSVVRYWPSWGMGLRMCFLAWVICWFKVYVYHQHVHCFCWWHGRVHRCSWCHDTQSTPCSWWPSSELMHVESKHSGGMH